MKTFTSAHGSKPWPFLRNTIPLLTIILVLFSTQLEAQSFPITKNVNGSISIGAQQAIPVNLGPDREVCSSGTVNLSASKKFNTYLWSTGATTQNITVGPGVYTCTATSFTGKVSTDTINVHTLGNPTAIFIFNGANSASTFSSISLNAKSFYWTFTDGGSSTDENPSHVFPATGTYGACLTVSNGCVTDDWCKDFYVNYKKDFAQEKELVAEIVAYPNPSSNGLFNIKTGSLQATMQTIRVRDIQGRMLTEKRVQLSNETDYKLDLSNFRKGIYFLMIEDGNRQITRKLISTE